MRLDKWTDKQWEAVQAYEKNGTYEEAATQLQITFQTVQIRCRTADWPQLKHAEQTLKKLETYSLRFHLAEGE